MHLNKEDTMWVYATLVAVTTAVLPAAAGPTCLQESGVTETASDIPLRDHRAFVR
jgi:hypothetical protein